MIQGSQCWDMYNEVVVLQHLIEYWYNSLFELSLPLSFIGNYLLLLVCLRNYFTDTAIQKLIFGSKTL